MARYTQTPPRSDRRGCTGCRGCLLILIILAGALVAAWFLGPVILRATGALPASAEEQYSAASDPVVAEALQTAITDAGIEGARVVVLPITDSDGHLAVITIDDSLAIRGDDQQSAEEAFLAAIRGLSAANVSGLHLDRAVLDIRDENGEPFIAATVDQASIDAFASGRIDRREFLRAVDADLSNLLDLLDVQALLRGG